MFNRNFSRRYAPRRGLATNPSGRRKRVARSGFQRRAAGALMQDVSHRNSIARGAAYIHMLADPWNSTGVRPPHTIPIPTMLFRSRTRFGISPSSVASGSNNLVIRVWPGAGAHSAADDPVENSQVKAQYFAHNPSTGLESLASTTKEDANAHFLYSSCVSYRPVAMGVRVLCATPNDDVGGVVYARLHTDPPGSLDLSSSSSAFGDIANDRNSSMAPWTPSRELKFVWHPTSQDNLNFTTIVSDAGPDAAADSDDVIHQHDSAIEIAIQTGTTASTNYIVSIVTWYECIVQDGYHDIVDTSLSGISSSDATLAQQLAAGSDPHPELLRRPGAMSERLSRAGITRAVSDVAHRAAGTLSGTIESSLGVVDSVLGVRGRSRSRVALRRDQAATRAAMRGDDEDFVG